MKDEKTFIGIFARNCIAKKINSEIASPFLRDNHRLGHTACKYYYGLYTIKKGVFPEGSLVAVGSFSNARKWIKEDKIIRSYEWVRYASLPRTRVIGGMGKILKTFIEECKPDDIMSYSDTEGDVYIKLGFKEEETKSFGEGKTSRKFRLKLTDYE